jgi:hypothetical protein
LRRSLSEAKIAIAIISKLCYIEAMFNGLVPTRCLRPLLHPRTCVPPLIVSQAFGQHIFLYSKELGER